MTTIDLSSNNFQINGVSLGFPMGIESLKKIFNSNNRKTTAKYNTIYTWDDLGILAYSQDGKSVDSLSILLELDDFKFNPKNSFSGKFSFNEEDIIDYYLANPEKRIKMFDGDSSGGLVLNNISVWFDLSDTKKGEIAALEIKAFQASKVTDIPKEKYQINDLKEEEIAFVDFGFKLSIIQELMYNKGLITPKFDLHEFVIWYDKRRINLEEEGYEPIPEVTQYFKDLPIPKRLAPQITQIYQDGGNEIYLQLLRFAEGWEDYWDIETAEDAKQFPNLEKATLCYAKENVIKELNNMNIKASWL